MLTLTVLLIPLIKVTKATSKSEKPAGDLIAEIVWDSESVADIDLWTQAPKGETVGYTKPYGKIFNLVRDDLGRDIDYSGLNYEFSFSRGIPDGIYRFSVVYYTDNGQGERPEQVRISIRYRQDRLMITIYETVMTLDYPGQEKGIVSFKMKDSKLVADSMSFEPFEIFHSTLQYSKPVK
ncbi:MAG: hypothetical protein ABFS05_12685 [Bacteroidota bacterium]